MRNDPEGIRRLPSPDPQPKMRSQRDPPRNKGASMRGSHLIHVTSMDPPPHPIKMSQEIVLYRNIL